MYAKPELGLLGPAATVVLGTSGQREEDTVEPQKIDGGLLTNLED